MAVSFAGLGFLAFYLAGKLHLFDERGHAVSREFVYPRYYANTASHRAKLGYP